MGNSCSSGQAHKDKDSVSQYSEESNCCSRRSPAYRVTKPSVDVSTEPAQAPEQHLLEPVSSIKESKPLTKGPRPVGSSISDSISLSSPVTCATPKEETCDSIPSNLACLSEELRTCLQGRLPGLRKRRRRAAVIYVCAADSQDCCAEKGVLQYWAAANVRARARSRGWRVHVADLHWRSPLEQQRDHRFPVLCIAEIARQSELAAIVPIVFLNSGLGTPLLPHTLECADFQAALDAADDENDKALLNKWYSLDTSNTPPCYGLVHGAPARWRREMAKTLDVLVRTLPQEARDAYLTTVVEQEIQHTVLMSMDTARRCLWVCRTEPETAKTETGDNTETVDNTKTGDSTETVYNTETGDSTETVDNNKTGDSTETVDNNKTGDSIETVDNNKTGDSIETVDNNKTGDSTETVDNNKTGDSTETVDNNKTGDSTETVDNTETSDNTKTGDITKTSDNTETGDITKTGDNTETGHNTETGDITKTAGENTENGDNTKTSGDNTENGDNTKTGGDNTENGDNTKTGGDNTENGYNTKTGGDNTETGNNTKTGGDITETDDNTKTGDDIAETDDNTKTGGDNTETGDNTKTGGDNTETGDNTKTGGDNTETGDNTKTGGDITETDDNTKTGDDITETGDNTKTGDNTETGVDTEEPVKPEPCDAAETAHNTELQRRLAKLQKELTTLAMPRNIIRPDVSCRSTSVGEEEYAESVRVSLGDRLNMVIDTLITENTSPFGYNGIRTTFFDEINEHIMFCQKASRCTSTRELAYKELKSYLLSDSNVPLAVIGSAGCGKTTLVAKAVLNIPCSLYDFTVIVRFIGLTAESSSSHQVLKSIVDQCHILCTGTLYRGKNDVTSLSNALPPLLDNLGRRKPVLVAIVGADALRAARWLPERLPDNVKMIITVTEEKDEPSSSAIMAVLSSEVGPKVMRMPTLISDEAKAIFYSCSGIFRRTESFPIPDDILRALEKCTLPLYAKSLAWQYSLSTETFKEVSEFEMAPDVVICEDLEGQLAQILVMAEAALGEEQVKTCLALLTAARRGLDDTEILDMLAHDDLFRSEETYLPWAPASLFWPQLGALLSPWLRWDGRGAARWRDAALASAAYDRYLQDREVAVRNTLIEYYEGLWYSENDPMMAGRLISQENKFSETYYNTRKLDELPYQHFHVYKHRPEVFVLQPYFTCLDWIEDKIAATDSCHYLEDLALVHMEPIPEHIEILKEMFENYAYALDHDHRQFYSLLRLTIEKRQKDDYRITSSVVDQWWREVNDPPIPTFYPMNGDYWGIDENKFDLSMLDGLKKEIDLIVCFDNRGKFVATISTEKEEICVWDVPRCQLVRKLMGVPHPMNIVPIDEYRCVVLCRRELRVYNFDQGTFVNALKGVMNQKMPYYGLHDETHLVALSRNRMYVNLMNIETGDCVTTFKAGEDRFLNSLIVSGDGRVLVCGDETQKPFPLLVWSLTSRKLLYDLRIPHHDFVMSIAAITYEGSYVVVVCRELDEPCPNFIVVYDLLSGTLFKKWKPGCDTVSLAINSRDGCVVSALSDNRIIIWDYITGNCRFVLRDHVAPATTLRLVKSGAVLLSNDDTCRDPTVRLWDLNTGRLISVFTTPERITSCEVLLGGSVLAIALENYSELLCVTLYGPVSESVVIGREYEYDDEPYGDMNLEGNVFDLKPHDTS